MMNSMTIQKWCASHGFSRGFFYILKKRNEAPATIKVGRAVRITERANREWLAEREASSDRRAA
jgi:predicted DNA-binding transcriptional regulator AlpA